MKFSFYSLPISFPSRLSLWMGVGFIVWGYYTEHLFLSILGLLCITIGIFLWIKYGTLSFQPFSFYVKKSVYSVLKKIPLLNRMTFFYILENSIKK